MDRGGLNHPARLGQGSGGANGSGGASLVAMINPQSPNGAGGGLGSSANAKGLGSSLLSSNVVVGTDLSSTMPLGATKKNTGVNQYARGKKELQGMNLMMGGSDHHGQPIR